MTARPRVVFIVEALTVGGAEHMLVAMANQFVERDWAVDMICLTNAGELAERLVPAVTQHVLGKRPAIDLFLPVRLRRLVRSLSPTAVNCHLWTANVWTRAALIGSGIPVFATEHSRDSWKSAWYRRIDRHLSHHCKRLIAVSEDTAAFYRDEIQVAPERLTVINNGIDTARFRTGNGTAVRQELDLGDRLVIGTIGRMVPAKNHPRLVAVAAALENQLTDFVIVVTGDGPERINLEAAIADARLSHRFVLTGTRSDTPDLLAAFDIFVLTSDREGHPLTALEAQASGTPVVLTDVGGCTDAVASDGQYRGGRLVEPTVQAISDALLELGQDASERSVMGRFAADYAASHFDLRHMVDRYERLFLDLPEVRPHDGRRFP